MRKSDAAGIEHEIETEQTKVLIKFIFIKMSSQQTHHTPPQNPQTIEPGNPASCLLAAMSLLTFSLMFYFVWYFFCHHRLRFAPSVMPWKIEFSRNLFELLTRFYYFMEQTEIPTPPSEGGPLFLAFCYFLSKLKSSWSDSWSAYADAVIKSKK